MRWHNDGVEMRAMARGNVVTDRFELVEGTLVGVLGYHRGERLDVVRRPDGSVSHLECATFVYTRTPYDPEVEIPGGHPRDDVVRHTPCDTLDMLKSGIRRAGVAVREK